MSDKKIIAFKGFDKNLKCRDFQYEIGQTYTHDGEVKACESGFHSCEYPLDVFGYYAPAENRFAEVHVSGSLSRHDSDSKIASARIEIKAEIKIPSLVDQAVKYIFARLDKEKTNTGNRSASTNTGDYSASTNTGNRSASTNTGDYSASTNTGDYSASEVGGKHSVALACGAESKAKAAESSAIVLVYRGKNGELIHIRCGVAGKDIKPDTWYMLSAEGEFVEVEE